MFIPEWRVGADVHDVGQRNLPEGDSPTNHSHIPVIHDVPEGRHSTTKRHDQRDIQPDGEIHGTGLALAIEKVNAHHRWKMCELDSSLPDLLYCQVGGVRSIPRNYNKVAGVSKFSVEIA